MSVERTYQGFTRTDEKRNIKTTEIYKGFKPEMEDFLAHHTPSGVTISGNFGELIRATFEQDEGPFWTVTLDWEKINFINQSNEDNEPQEASLNCRMLSLPLEKAR